MEERKFKITNNLGLKIVSLVFAAIMWFLVTNMSDPVVARRFTNVAVQLLNASAITGNNQVYEVLDDSDNIGTVTIYAPRSIADAFTEDDIIATADLTNLSSVDTASIQLSTTRYSSQIESITGSINTVRLKIEDRANKTLQITADTTGTLKDGYTIDSVTTDNNQLRITGPASVVSAVESARVSADVTGFTQNIGTDSEISLYDGDDNLIESDAITMSTTTVRVNVVILQTKWVDLNVVTSGNPANGYRVTEIESVPDKVQIAGKSGTLDGIRAIDVEDESLNVQGRTSDLQTAVDITPYLPEGVSYGDNDFNGFVNIVVRIGQAGAEDAASTESTSGEENADDAGTAASDSTKDETDR